MHNYVKNYPSAVEKGAGLWIDQCYSYISSRKGTFREPRKYSKDQGFATGCRTDYSNIKARKGGEGRMNKFLLPCSAHPGRQHTPCSYSMHSDESRPEQQLPRLTAGAFPGVVEDRSNGTPENLQNCRSYLSIFTLLMCFVCEQRLTHVENERQAQVIAGLQLWSYGSVAGPKLPVFQLQTRPPSEPGEIHGRCILEAAIKMIIINGFFLNHSGF